MSHSAAHAGHAIKLAFERVKELEPLNSEKSVVAAFLAGFFFSFFGVGLYLNSWKDFFISLELFLGIFLVFLPTVAGEVLGVPTAWIFSAVYAAYRVHTSNERL
jgi:hypothetical protein